jgi:hypothetical protein
MALARIEHARREGRGAGALDVTLVAVTALVCVAALVAGFVAMTHK